MDTTTTPMAERSIPVDWLLLKQALRQEVAALADPTFPGCTYSFDVQRQHQQVQLFDELLSLLELLTHTAYAKDARALMSAMLLAKPQLADDERRIMWGAGVTAGRRSVASGSSAEGDSFSSGSSTAGVSGAAAVWSEQQLLDGIIQLLLRARYTPLTRDEWDIAQENQFTFGETAMQGAQVAGTCGGVVGWFAACKAFGRGGRCEHL